jgi:hypothetical protein
MRGFTTTLSNGFAASAVLNPNTSSAESASNDFRLTSTGFVDGGNIIANGTVIYMAIRRPMKVPTDGTKVFMPSTTTATTGTAITTGFTVDSQIFKKRSGAEVWVWNDRLRGINTNSTSAPRPYLDSASTSAESNSTGLSTSFSNTGYNIGSSFSGVSMSYLNFKRAPGFFDVVCYTGTGANMTVAHNLGVAPELMIVKPRNNASSWGVASSKDWSKFLTLNSTSAESAATLYGTPDKNNFYPTSSGGMAGSGTTYVAYLFASCPGVSKVGSYTGNGSSQTINCGFAAGARFVLIKRTDSTGDWYVWDTARGIVAGNDPHLSLNTMAAEVTTNDTIDPDSTGFIVNQVTATNVNVNAASYIYLAIA